MCMAIKLLNVIYCSTAYFLTAEEFRPGEPWKGLQNIDPETDPNVTPGSVPSGPSINTTIRDVDRYLLRDRSGGKKANYTNYDNFHKKTIFCVS